jgi:hypothetical protein
VRLIAFVFGALVISGATPPNWLTFRTDGVSLRYPPGSHVTARRLTGVIWPPQLVAVASYPIRQKNPDAGCGPRRAIAEMPSGGAFVFVMEYTGSRPKLQDFPPRPKRFRLTGFASYECFGPSYNIRFRQSGRYFQVQVYLGPNARPAVRSSVLLVLDSFKA